MSEPVARYDDKDIARILDMSIYWVQAQAKANRFPHLKLGKHRRYTDEHVKQIVALLEVKSVDPLARSARSRKGRAAA